MNNLNKVVCQQRNADAAAKAAESAARYAREQQAREEKIAAQAKLVDRLLPEFAPKIEAETQRIFEDVKDNIELWRDTALPGSRRMFGLKPGFPRLPLGDSIMTFDAVDNYPMSSFTLYLRSDGKLFIRAHRALEFSNGTNIYDHVSTAVKNAGGDPEIDLKAILDHLKSYHA